MKIDVNKVLLSLVLFFLVLNFFFKDAVIVSPYTQEDIERSERSAVRETEMKALRLLININEQIIKEDEKIIDSTINFVAVHYRTKRDSLRAIAFSR